MSKHLKKSRIAAKHVSIIDQPVPHNDQLIRVLVQPSDVRPVITIVRRVG